MTPAQAVSAKLEKANEGTSHRMSLELERCVEVATSDQIALLRVVPISEEKFGSQTGSCAHSKLPHALRYTGKYRGKRGPIRQPLDGVQRA